MEPYPFDKELKYIIYRMLLELKNVILVLCSEAFISGVKDRDKLKEYDHYID